MDGFQAEGGRALVKGLRQEIKRIKRLLAETDSPEQKRQLRENLEQTERQLADYRREGDRYLF